MFAEGFMAKEVRKFVQSFNMSRQLADQQIDLREQEEPQTLISEGQFQVNRINNKRTDWTEYLDCEDESVEKEDEQSTGFVRASEDGMGTRVVTELPKAVFKRPKISNYSAGSESDCQNRFRPVFTKRNARKQSSIQEKDIGLMAKRAPEWEDGTAVSQDAPSCWSKSTQVAKSNEYFVNGEPSKGSLLTTATAKGEIISKWSEYLTADEDDSY